MYHLLYSLLVWHWWWFDVIISLSMIQQSTTISLVIIYYKKWLRRVLSLFNGTCKCILFFISSLQKRIFFLINLHFARNTNIHSNMKTGYMKQFFLVHLLHTSTNMVQQSTDLTWFQRISNDNPIIQIIFKYTNLTLKINILKQCTYTLWNSTLYLFT